MNGETKQLFVTECHKVALIAEQNLTFCSRAFAKIAQASREGRVAEGYSDQEIQNIVEVYNDLIYRIAFIWTKDYALAVCRLPEKYRVVIHLFYYEEFSIKEIKSLHWHIHFFQGFSLLLEAKTKSSIWICSL